MRRTHLTLSSVHLHLNNIVLSVVEAISAGAMQTTFRFLHVHPNAGRNEDSYHYQRQHDPDYDTGRQGFLNNDLFAAAASVPAGSQGPLGGFWRFSGAVGRFGWQSSGDGCNARYKINKIDEIKN